MNYGVKATKKRIRAANSRKKKYANRLFLTFFKTAFVLVLFLCVTGVSTFIGMFKAFWTVRRTSTRTASLQADIFLLYIIAPGK